MAELGLGVPRAWVGQFDRKFNRLPGLLFLGLIMKAFILLFPPFLALALFQTGCTPAANPSETVAEGVILSVEYELGDGQTGGFTRLNNSAAVPGKSGSWNVDAYGRLTREFLVITRLLRKDLGPKVIPAHRLVNVQFGDGGIQDVDENKPKT